MAIFEKATFRERTPPAKGLEAWSGGGPHGVAEDPRGSPHKPPKERWGERPPGGERVCREGA